MKKAMNLKQAISCKQALQEGTFTVNTPLTVFDNLFGLKAKDNSEIVCVGYQLHTCLQESNEGNLYDILLEKFTELSQTESVHYRDYVNYHIMSVLHKIKHGEDNEGYLEFVTEMGRIFYKTVPKTAENTIDFFFTHERMDDKQLESVNLYTEYVLQSQE
ncbi:MAG: hypothetical protein WBH49_07040 [Flavobacteriaceae bacterium]